MKMLVRHWNPICELQKLFGNQICQDYNEFIVLIYYFSGKLAFKNRDDTHMTSMKIVQFSKNPTPLFVYVQNSFTP